MTCLPRPKRFASDPAGQFLNEAITDAIRLELAKPYPDAMLVRMLCERVPRLATVMQLSTSEGAPPQILSMMATELAFQHAGGVIVELTPTLIELLLNTDLDATEHLTADDLQLPFDSPIFLRAPSDAAALQVFGHDALLPLDGFYLRRTHIDLDHASLDGVPPGIYDGIDIVCLSQPTAPDAPLDDAYFHCPLAWSQADGAITISKIVEQRHQQMSGGDPAMLKHFKGLMDQFKPLLEFVLKALIYLNLPEARRRRINEASELAQRMRGLGPKKQARLARQQARAYDRIEVGPTAEEMAGQGGLTAQGLRSVAPHYRRGHFRRQRFGEGREQSRIVWIKPVLVAFSPAMGQQPAPKAYRVSA